MNEYMITTKEAAKRLGVSRVRVQQFITEGRLPAIKIGRDLWIDERDLMMVQRRPTGRPPRR